MTKKKLVFSILLIGIMYVSAILSGFFKTKRVECYTQYGSCPDNYTQTLSWLKSQQLLIPLPHQAVFNNLNSFPEIKNVTLYRRLPSTLIISIAVRKSIGVAGPQVLGESVAVDEDGIVIGRVQDSILPFLLLNSGPLPDSRLSPSQSLAIKALSVLAPLSPHRLNGSLKDTTLSVWLFPETEVLINVEHQTDIWYPSLQLILNRAKIVAKSPHKIDLRFIDPIITN